MKHKSSYMAPEHYWRKQDYVISITSSSKKKVNIGKEEGKNAVYLAD